MAQRKKGSRKTTKSSPDADSAFQASAHELVPTHEKLSVKEAKEVLDKHHASITELPKIHRSDPAIAGLQAQGGDIIRITRRSRTAGEAVFYRGVIDE